MADRPGKVYTIGYSDRTLDELVAQLRDYGIDTVVDVRSKPYSRRLPHFSREAVRDGLKAAGFRYAWMGDTLGGIPAEARFYGSDGRVDYASLAATERFRGALAKLVRALEQYRVVLMCAEADPSGCHRHRLVALALLNEGIAGEDIVHILRDGTNVAESAMIRQPSLFGGGQWKSSPLGSRKPPQSTSSDDFSPLE